MSGNPWIGQNNRKTIPCVGVCPCSTRFQSSLISSLFWCEGISGLFIIKTKPFLELEVSSLISFTPITFLFPLLMWGNLWTGHIYNKTNPHDGVSLLLCSLSCPNVTESPELVVVITDLSWLCVLAPAFTPHKSSLLSSLLKWRNVSLKGLVLEII